MAWGIIMAAVALIGMMGLAIREASTARVCEPAAEKEGGEFKKAA